MRPVELVVRYFEGDPLPQDDLEWAGVFIADSDEEVEQAFADAEPPAHDDWLPQSLEKGPKKTFVTVALRRIREKAKSVAAAPEPATQDQDDAGSLARLSGRLGVLLDHSFGEGGSRRRPDGGGGRGGGRPRAARLSSPEFVRLEEADGLLHAVFACEVSGTGGSGNYRIVTTPAVALDGAPAPDFADAASFTPVVRGIRDDAGLTIADGEAASIGNREGRFEILVEIPGDSAVTLTARLEGEAES